MCMHHVGFAKRLWQQYQQSEVIPLVERSSPANIFLKLVLQKCVSRAPKTDPGVQAKVYIRQYERQAASECQTLLPNMMQRLKLLYCMLRNWYASPKVQTPFACTFTGLQLINAQCAWWLIDAGGTVTYLGLVCCLHVGVGFLVYALNTTTPFENVCGSLQGHYVFLQH